MLAVLTIVTPVFALMGLGFLAARFKVLPDGSAQALAQFAFKIAIPVLLFRGMLNSGAMEASPWRLLAAYFMATTCVWLLASGAARIILGRPAQDHAPFAMAATFGNTVMLGVPIVITAFGPDVTAPAALLIAIETPLLWIAATMHMELTRPGQKMSSAALAAVLKDLATNPVVISLVFGLAGWLMGLKLPAVPDRIFAMLGQAGVPIALFAMGMMLAGFSFAGEGRALVSISLLKLLVYPVVAYVLAAHVFALPPLWVAIVTLQAAMPVGANAFLFAARYNASAPTISAAIAVSTVIAVATVSAVLVFLKGGAG